MTNVQNKLNQLRTNRGISLSKLSEQLKEKYGIAVSPSQLNYYEKGERSPRNQNVWESLAKHFGVSVGYLLGYATVGDVMELATRVMTNQIKLEDISDENTRKAVSDYINLNKGLATNQPFKTDHSMLSAIEKIDDIKLIDEMITDSMLANRILDRLRGYLLQSDIIGDEYNWEIERVMGWLIDLNNELFKREMVLSDGKISSSSNSNYRGDDSIKSGDDESPSPIKSD